ncbi:MAG: ATP phosphoribosyltransferase [Oscillospiraceae bacterium]|nr:ATP phosphoribosyltransferase [Oscillospiraceae bacterium]MDD4367665.1 ATP phosphoribosyltransferase [Oscillospiraceae bacterium]
MRDQALTVALPKGRLGDLVLQLLNDAGLDCNFAAEKSRKLILANNEDSLHFFLAKPSDVPTYVEYGAADIGFVGKDTLLEDNRSLYEVADLGIGRCRMCVCGPGYLQGHLDELRNKRVATKYPHIARQYFETVKRESVEIIKLNGSVELAPLVGLADVIVDIVESGRTLRENNLEVLETVADISARMVVNRVSMRMKAAAVRPLLEQVRQVLNQRESEAEV